MHNCYHALILETIIVRFLAYHIARSMIGYWHNNVVRSSVCLSVCLFVTLCTVAKRHTPQQKCHTQSE